MKYISTATIVFFAIFSTAANCMPIDKSGPTSIQLEAFGYQREPDREGAKYTTFRRNSEVLFVRQDGEILSFISQFRSKTPFEGERRARMLKKINELNDSNVYNIAMVGQSLSFMKYLIGPYHKKTVAEIIRAMEDIDRQFFGDVELASLLDD
jgi:hypothetical protein